VPVHQLAVPHLQVPPGKGIDRPGRWEVGRGVVSYAFEGVRHELDGAFYAPEFLVNGLLAVKANSVFELLIFPFLPHVINDAMQRHCSRVVLTFVWFWRQSFNRLPSVSTTTNET